MKLQLGYFDRDGQYIGRKLDTNRRKKYFIAIGTLRKKIAEHADQSPYKTHPHIVPYSKNYCDRQRVLVHYVEFENGRMKKEMREVGWRYSDPNYERTYNIMKRIREYIIANHRRLIPDERVEIIYFPDGNQKELRERRR
jgi:hypothetical protein